MKKKILIGVVIIVISFIAIMAYRVLNSRPLSPVQTAVYNYQGIDMKVVYCSPFKKGRLLFGDVKDSPLVPNGKYWRLGANDATEVSFNKNIDFAGRPVNAGRYRMYAVPNHDSWNIRLNSELGKFGYNEPNYSLDVVTVDVPVETTSSELEQFTISFDTVDSSGVKMIFKWDRTLVRVPLMVQGNL